MGASKATISKLRLGLWAQHASAAPLCSPQPLSWDLPQPCLMLPGTASTHASFPSSFLCPHPGRKIVSLQSSPPLGLGWVAQGPCLALLPTAAAHNPGWGLSLSPPQLALQAPKESPERGGSLVAWQGGEELLSSELRRAATLPRNPAPRGLRDCTRCKSQFFAGRGGTQGRLAENYEGNEFSYFTCAHSSAPAPAWRTPI